MEFFRTHGKAGRVGLVGGTSGIDRAIRKAQRRLSPVRAEARYSHAFLIEGPREDGEFWALESDIDFHRERVQIGVQENRIDKYGDEAEYPHVAILDFGVAPEGVRRMLGLGLELLSGRTQYSLREILATYVALQRPDKRAKKNLLSRERAMFCSAFVQHLFLEVGIDFADDVETKLTSPEDIANTTVPHTAWVRKLPASAAKKKR